MRTHVLELAVVSSRQYGLGNVKQSTPREAKEKSRTGRILCGAIKSIQLSSSSHNRLKNLSLESINPTPHIIQAWSHAA